MAFTLKFLYLFGWSLYLTGPLILFLAFVITGLGFVVGRLEGWHRFESLYWAFITATTVGYGDIRPQRKISRVLSVVVALTGIMFTGILVALTVTVATKVFADFADPVVINHIKKLS